MIGASNRPLPLIRNDVSLFVPSKVRTRNLPKLFENQRNFLNKNGKFGCRVEELYEFINNASLINIVTGQVEEEYQF